MSPVGHGPPRLGRTETCLELSTVMSMPSSAKYTLPASSDSPSTSTPTDGD